MVHIDNEVKLDYKDVLIRPKRSTLKSRSDVDLERTIKFKYSGQEFTGIPIIVSNMDTTGTFEMATVLSKYKFLVALHKHYSTNKIINFLEENKDVSKYCGISAGASDDDFHKISDILSIINIKDIGFICLDVANGYSENFVKCVRRYREAFPKATIMAGNVVTSEMTEQLILAGADIVKVGIGPGSVCTTRKQTGVGYPQLSAILECADAAHGLGGRIVGDGGIQNIGDFCKGFCAGADFLMAGGMFAGYNENSGDIVSEDGVNYIVFYGMSSSMAMDKYSNGVSDYRASEGKIVKIECKGSVKNLALDIMGGIRSMCTYIGASKLKEVSKRCTFIRVSQQLNHIFGNQKNDMRKN